MAGLKEKLAAFLETIEDDEEVTEEATEQVEPQVDAVVATEAVETPVQETVTLTKEEIQSMVQEAVKTSMPKSRVSASARQNATVDVEAMTVKERADYYRDSLRPQLLREAEIARR